MTLSREFTLVHKIVILFCLCDVYNGSQLSTPGLGCDYTNRAGGGLQRNIGPNACDLCC